MDWAIATVYRGDISKNLDDDPTRDIAVTTT